MFTLEAVECQTKRSHQMPYLARQFFLALLLLLIVSASHAQTPYGRPVSNEIEGLAYELSLYPDGAQHDPSIPTPDALLGFPVGQRSATSAQIVEYAYQLAGASNRVQVIEYGRTYEKRPLIYLVISSPENLARQDTIQANMARLADPREGLSQRQRENIVAGTPAVAWMSYSIHGNENSGSDASLVVMHHLASDQSPKTQQLLKDLVIIVDPNKNPDGRERHLNAIEQNRGLHPNIDDQALLHGGYWPYGRGNHYLFDLNRDWIYARHPETRGRIREITKWRPVLLVDAHEMGAQDTFLFSPPREPHNPHLPPYRKGMADAFADDQARAYDQFGYPYYSGEWNEDWYPGYTDAWASMRGALGILYEQARLAEDGVQRDTHNISYKQSVHHQAISSFANLETLARERETMLTAFAEDRASVVSDKGPYANRSWVILPTDNAGRLKDLLDLVAIQSFEVHVVTEDMRLSQAKNPWGQVQRDVMVPAGALVLRNRQPEARSLAAMFEFDPQISESALIKEREAVLGEGDSTIYDTTGWNITMMFGLDAYEVPEHLERHLKPIDPASHAAGMVESANQPTPETLIAWVASGADDRANALAARLMEQGVHVRANKTASELDGIELPMGSIAVTMNDNRHLSDWQARVKQTASALKLTVHPVGFGRAPGDLADLGGGEWEALTQPKVALVSRGMVNMLDVGAVWWMLDHRLGIRSSQLDEKRASWMDLRRYNVIYLPERWGGPAMPAAMQQALQTWVAQGGTLIAVGNSARALMMADDAMVSTRMLSGVVGDDLSPYQDQVHREWLAERDPLPDNIWGHEAAPTSTPWSAIEKKVPPSDERKRNDQWNRQFMPSGALVATRPVGDHWLNAGRNEFMSVLFSNSPILMASNRVEAPVRVGAYVAAQSEAHHVGWAPVPEGHALTIRMGGLLWPEGRERLASGAWVTRERIGQGQVILFAHAPAFRAAQLGAMRVLENALILGPGLGANAAIELP